jgi:hypothetical protein
LETLKKNLEKEFGQEAIESDRLSFFGRLLLASTAKADQGIRVEGLGAGLAPLACLVCSPGGRARTPGAMRWNPAKLEPEEGTSCKRRRQKPD